MSPEVVGLIVDKVTGHELHDLAWGRCWLGSGFLGWGGSSLLGWSWGSLWLGSGLDGGLWNWSRLGLGLGFFISSWLILLLLQKLK